MFMCSSCKHCGQWNSLDYYLQAKKPKKKSEVQEDFNKNKEKLIECLNQVRENSKVLTTINKYESVLKQFKLPVCILVL